MDFLDPPFQYLDPPPGLQLQLPVVRWELGQVTRAIKDPPFYVVKPGLRLHLGPSLPPSLGLYVLAPGAAEGARMTPADLLQRPYVDFTNKVLTGSFLELYRRRLRDVVKGPQQIDARLALALEPEASEPLTVHLTRRGLGIDTVYDVEIVGP